MNTKTLSNKTFFILLAILVLVVGVNALLPQAPIPGVTMPAASMPVWQMALAGMGVTAVLYGLLGFLGLILWRKLSFPDIWDESVTNRQRFLVPALAGVGMGVFIIIADLLFSPVNGIGRLMHPQFPTSLLAAVSAGIGEEIIFRLFFISFWTWLIGKVILRGRGLPIVSWVVARFSAVADVPVECHRSFQNVPRFAGRDPAIEWHPVDGRRVPVQEVWIPCHSGGAFLGGRDLACAMGIDLIPSGIGKQLSALVCKHIYLR
jgi:hypothetical protein